MNRALHIARMQQTAERTIPLILGVYAPLMSSQTFASAVRVFLDNRTKPGQPLLRPYFVRLAYELCDGGDWESIAPACAAAEVLNISSYQANVAFDGKLTIATQEERAQQFGCAMVSLECAQRLLASMGLCPQQTLRLVEGMQSANREMYLGQIMDLTELQIENISRERIDHHLRLYTERCRKLGGAFTSWCLQLGAQLAGASEEDLSLIAEIGLELGMAGQMVNDVGDYVPIQLPQGQQRSTRYQHVFSDIVNGKATFPILHAFKQGESEVCALATRIHKEQIKDMQVLRACAQHLHSIGAFAAARDAIRDHHRSARDLLCNFPRSKPRDYFALAFSTLTHNKYFTALRSQKETVRPATRCRPSN